jgi:hypothetical protein
MHNLTHSEDHSLDIEHTWYKDQCFFKIIRNSDDLGVHSFEFALADEDIEDLREYLKFVLRKQ